MHCIQISSFILFVTGEKVPPQLATGLAASSTSVIHQPINLFDNAGTQPQNHLVQDGSCEDRTQSSTFIPVQPSTSSTNLEENVSPPEAMQSSSTAGTIL